MNTEPEKLVELIRVFLSSLSGLESAQIHVCEKKSNQLSKLQSSVTELSHANQVQVSVCGLLAGRQFRCQYASTNPTDLRECLSSIEKRIESLEKNSTAKFSPSNIDSNFDDDSCFDKTYDIIPMEEKLHKVENLRMGLEKIYADQLLFSNVKYREVQTREWFWSTGSARELSLSRTDAFIETVASIGRAEQSEQIWDCQEITQYYDIDWSSIAKSLASWAQRPLIQTRLEMGQSSAILSNKLVCLLVELFFTQFSAQQVQNGLSKFKASDVGKRILPQIVSFQNDPRYKKGLGSRSWDAQGMKTKTIPFITQGILTEFAHDLDSAHAFKTEGNACSYRDFSTGQARQRFQNLMLEPGAKDYVDLLRDLGRGLLLLPLDKNQILLGPDGNQFIANVKAVLVENGEEKSSLGTLSIRGNLTDLFASVAAVSRDVVSLNCVVAPSLLCEKVEIIGRAL